MSKLFPASLVPAIVLGMANPAIIRRHDQPDAEYLSLGERYTTVVHLDLPTPQGASDGEGTLISPRWVITAAHVATELKAGHRVRIGGRQFRLDSIITHPDWRDGPHDLGLLRLENPARHIPPACLFRESTELDRILVLAGYGDWGTGITGPEGNDGRVRGATNRVDEATEFWLKMAFDAPGSPRTTPLEGVSGPGDSGGPAYLAGATRETLVGVSSAQSTRGAAGPGRYGAVEYYVRVSRYIGWIEGITGPLGC